MTEESYYREPPLSNCNPDEALEKIQKLAEVQQSITPLMFRKAFGDSLGFHLWDKFESAFRFNLLLLFKHLDLTNQRKLIYYLGSPHGQADLQSEQSES